MNKFIFFVFLLSSISFAKINLAFVTLGGGYPGGIIGDLNSSFEKAYKMAVENFGASRTESLTKTQGGSFSANIAFRFIDTAFIPRKMQFGGLIGYSYHGTGEAKWQEKYDGYDLSVSGKYSISEIRFTPVALIFNENITGLGVGAGGAYNFVNYNQKQTSNLPSIVSLPNSLSSLNSGFTWLIWGMLRYQIFGIEASFTGVNRYYIGAFICVP